MASIRDLSLEDFEPKLSSLTVKVLQVLVLAVVMTPVMAAGVVLYLGFSGWGPSQPPQGGVALAGLASGAHLAVLLVGVPVIWTTTLARFRDSSLERYARDGLSVGEGSHLKDAADIAFHLVRLETLIPLAALEAAALAGIVAAFLAVNEGSIHRSTFYWLNLVSVGFVVARGVMAFPSGERLRRVFVTRIKKQAP